MKGEWNAIDSSGDQRERGTRERGLRGQPVRNEGNEKGMIVRRRVCEEGRSVR